MNILVIGNGFNLAYGLLIKTFLQGRLKLKINKNNVYVAVKAKRLLSII